MTMSRWFHYDHTQQIKETNKQIHILAYGKNLLKFDFWSNITVKIDGGVLC
jgi:hypothetical protein